MNNISPSSLAENAPLSNAFDLQSIAYNALPTYRPEEGLVCLLINKRIDEVKSASPSFTEVLHRDVIKSPNISVFLDSIHDMGNNQTQVVVYVFEKSPTGTGKKFTSAELMAAFEQPGCKTALGNLAVVNMTEMTEISKVRAPTSSGHRSRCYQGLHAKPAFSRM